MRRAAFFLATLGATLAVLAFLVLPVAAIFTHVSPGTLVSQLSNPVVVDALVVSAKTTLYAQALVLLVGTPAAYLLATRRFRGRTLVVTAILKSTSVMVEH
jgi:molybdate transport system permease protein